MKVLAIGSIVKIGSEREIKAEIIAICLRINEYVTYEVAWWDGQSRKSEWITQNEMKFDSYNTPYDTIGYVNSS